VLIPLGQLLLQQEWAVIMLVAVEVALGTQEQAAQVVQVVGVKEQTRLAVLLLLERQIQALVLVVLVIVAPQAVQELL